MLGYVNTLPSYFFPSRSLSISVPSSSLSPCSSLSSSEDSWSVKGMTSSWKKQTTMLNKQSWIAYTVTINKALYLNTKYNIKFNYSTIAYLFQFILLIAVFLNPSSQKFLQIISQIFIFSVKAAHTRRTRRGTHGEEFNLLWFFHCGIHLFYPPHIWKISGKRKTGIYNQEGKRTQNAHKHNKFDPTSQVTLSGITSSL